VKGNPWANDDRRFYSFLYDEGGDRREIGDYLPVALSSLAFTGPLHDCRGSAAGVRASAIFGAGWIPQHVRSGCGSAAATDRDAIRKTRRLDQITDTDFRKIQAVYLGMISYSDWLLGELMAALERTRRAADTALFVFSDHGEWGGDYGLVEKWPSACDDVLTHVPLIARLPATVGAAKGHVSLEIVELYDVMATCLELAGIPPTTRILHAA
jgi:hypothetical protein